MWVGGSGTGVGALVDGAVEVATETIGVDGRHPGERRQEDIRGHEPPAAQRGQLTHRHAVAGSATASQYCDGGTAGTGALRLDSPGHTCWTPSIPAVQFTATG